MKYKYKTAPFAHQEEIFEDSRDREYCGYVCEQGTGKTKITIDVAGWLWMQDEINALVVIAPNGVDYQWAHEQVPCHAAVPYRVACFKSSMTKAQQEALDALWDHEYDGLRILTFNVESFSARSKKAPVYLRKFLNATRAMMVVDESHRIKTPGATCTKELLKLATHARYRRILTGTPLTKAPLDYYTQIRFLHRDILGYHNYYSFRARYAEMVEEYNGRTGRKYKRVIGYRNIDELKRKIAPYIYRVRKADCLDLPNKIYKTRYVELSKQQRKYYNSMRDELRVVFEHGELTAQLAISKLLRLQQITGGFVPLDDGRIVALDGAHNAKLAALLADIESIDGNVIIWARFVQEIKAISRALADAYGDESVVTYHGEVSKADRECAKTRFQDSSDSARFFVASQQAAGTGLDLYSATTVFYYSNSFKLVDRLQSEDRCHRIGTTNKVTYNDLIAIDTLDDKIMQNLRGKLEMSQEILNDPPSNWI